MQARVRGICGRNQKAPTLTVFQFVLLPNFPSSLDIDLPQQTAATFSTFADLVTTANKMTKVGGFEQRPWTPTKRRGPIAAEHSSPGPALVQLPSLFGEWDYYIWL